jgi:chemotaxis protein CheD
MLDLENELLEVYLHPGELYVALKPTVIRTILGSCVGVSFWSPRLGVGALCHALLPWCPVQSSTESRLNTGRRYVDFSMRYLAQKFDDLGTPRSEVQVKLFGGGDVLPIAQKSRPKQTVGQANCEAALEVARAEGLNIVASSLGGTSGLIIWLDTSSGEVLLRRLT